MWLPRTPKTLVVAALLAPWLGWAIVRTFGLEDGHPLTPAIAFTPFVAATAWVPLLVAIVLRRWKLAVLALVTLAALTAGVAPRALPGPERSVAGGRPLVVMTANLAYGNADPEAVMALVRRHRVDLLSLQELPPEAVERLDAAGARSWFAHRVLDPRPGAQGSGLMSRYPLRDPARPTGTRLAMPQALLEVPGARPVEVKAVHPVPPLRADVAVWRSEIRSLPPATPRGALRMLVGDFNATLDHRELRSLLGTGYDDVADAVGSGLQGTYRQGRWLPPQVTIDHVLVDRRIGVSAARVHTLPGSDHRTLIARVVLPPTSAPAAAAR